MARETDKPRLVESLVADVTVSLLILSYFSFSTVVLASDPPTRLITPTTQAASASKPATQPTAMPTATMAHWFADLANPDGNRRNQAFEYMMSLRAQDLPALRVLVEMSRPLAPEQRMALPQIVTQVFLAGDVYDTQDLKGFLGIHLPPPGTGMYGEGAIVVDRIPGFVGARVLRNGDMILGIAQLPTLVIRSSTDLIDALVKMDAGTKLDIQVLRQGQVIYVAVKLDPRPLTDPLDSVSAMDAFDRDRRERAEEYWETHFADLIDDVVL